MEKPPRLVSISDTLVLTNVNERCALHEETEPVLPSPLCANGDTTNRSNLPAFDISFLTPPVGWKPSPDYAAFLAFSATQVDNLSFPEDADAPGKN